MDWVIVVDGLPTYHFLPGTLAIQRFWRTNIKYFFSLKMKDYFVSAELATTTPILCTLLYGFYQERTKRADGLSDNEGLTVHISICSQKNTKRLQKMKKLGFYTTQAISSSHILHPVTIPSIEFLRFSHLFRLKNSEHNVSLKKKK